MFEDLWETDREVAEAIGLEIERQNKKLELIASENFVSEAVLVAQGSPLTNKYAEGYPGKRYYGGCEYYDIIESLAVERAKKLFGADHANVQPHAGAQANMAAYDALLEPGDVVLGMDLSHGGHLTHGSRVNFSGKLYEFHHYGVAQGTETIDFDEVLQIARRVKPRLIVAGASAYPRIIHFDRFREICDQVGALFMVDMAHIAGLVVVGLHPNPVEYADVVTTTTHKTLRGGRGGMILCREEYAKAIDKAVFPGLQGGPLMHAIAGKAVALKEASTPEFRAYQEQVLRNARQLAASLMDRGFRLVSGGTDNHLMLVDVKHRGMTGREAEQRLDSVGVTVNRNTIPFETEKPMVTSGIRLGTPALTSRGMREEQMQTIAQVIEWALLGGESERSRAQEAVRELCEQFPLYSGLREFFASRGVVSA